MGVTSTLVPLDSNGTSAPVQPVGAAARAGLQVPNWRLLRGRAAQSPIDDTIRRQLSDVFFPNDDVSVDISHSLSLQAVDDSDEAYARDSPQILAAIAADFPHFRMEHRRPEPQHRTPWPIKFYHPPGSQHVRSRMDFDEVDYGIHFSPFLADAMLPNLSGEQRTWLMKTVRMRRRLCVRLFHRLLILSSRHWRVRRTAAFGCTWVFCLACIPLPCRHVVANAALLSLKKLTTSTLTMLLETA